MKYGASKPVEGGVETCVHSCALAEDDKSNATKQKEKKRLRIGVSEK
jgi:hypothetical protein